MTQASSDEQLKEFLSTPSARRATRCWDYYYAAGQFLSTPSARRATSQRRPFPKTASNFYPRPPRGGRRAGRLGLQQSAGFLSTPSARRATGLQFPHQGKARFLSTPSARRATCLR